LDSTVDSLETYWNAKGNVKCVRLRRNKDKSFKGSCFIEFSSEQEANDVLKETHKVGETTLITMLRSVYTDKKKEELKKKKEDQKEKKGNDKKKGKKKRKADGQPEENGEDNTEKKDEIKKDENKKRRKKVKMTTIRRKRS